jgi:uncharacterized protein with HEPN domain
LPQRSWRFRIEDIIDAARRIEAYTAGMTEEGFSADSMVQEAVSFNLIVIGEAAAALPEEFVQAHPEVPWKLMRGMRNVLAHQYFMTDVEVLWRTAVEDVPPLVEKLEPLVTDARS